MTVTAEQDTYTPHASSTVALKEAVVILVEAQTALKAIDLRSLKGDMRDTVRRAREEVELSLKVSRRK